MPPELATKAADITSPQIIELCERVVSSGTPNYLNVELGLAPDAIVNNCYGNVAKLVVERGGTIQHGWQIWETLPGVMAEAEFHAVWVDDQGVYHDITPKEDSGITRIAFVPDSARRFEGAQINTVRMVLVEDPLLEEYIQTEEEDFEVKNRGSLANQLGEIQVTPEMQKIAEKKCLLFLRILEKYYANI